MRLLKDQYQDILNAFQDFGIGPDLFTLTKKKGRIRIQVSGNESFIEFFRRKAVELNRDDLQWHHYEHYEINIAGQLHIVSNWTEFIDHLKAWIDSQRNG